MGSSLVDAVGTALGPGHEALDDGAGGGVGLRNVELLRVHAVVVLGVGSRTLDQLGQRLGGGLGGQGQDGVGTVEPYTIEPTAVPVAAIATGPPLSLIHISTVHFAGILYSIPMEGTTFFRLPFSSS